MLGPVVVGDAEQHEQAGADLGDALALDRDRGARDALDERPHVASARADMPATPTPVVHASEDAA